MGKRVIEEIGAHKLEQVFLSVEDHIAVMTLHNPPGQRGQRHRPGGDPAAVRLHQP